MTQPDTAPKKRERTPEEKKRFAALMVVFFTVFIDLVGFAIIIPVLQPYALHYGATDIQATLLVAVFSIFQFLFAPFWGWISDRMGRRPILLLTLLGTSASYVVLGWADSLAMIFVGRILAGVFSGNIAVAQAYIADVTPPEKRAHGMGMIGAAFGLGFVFGPALGGILSHISFSLPAYAASVASFLAFLIGLAKLEESLKDEHRTREEPWNHPLLNLRKILSEPPVLAVVIANFLWMVTFSMWETVFVLFVGSEVLLDVDEKHLAVRVGYLFAYMGILSAFIQGGMIRQLIKRYSEKGLGQTGFVIYIVGSLSFLIYDFYAVGGGAWALVPAMTLIALGQGLVNPTLSAIVSKLVSPKRQGEVLGSYRAIGSLARVVGPILGGAFYVWVHHSSPYVLGALLISLAILCLAREFPFYRVETNTAGAGEPQ